jgi:hypothetical protein
MLSKLSLILACGVLASLFSITAQASPFSSVRPQPTAADITLVRDGCGLGFHLAPCGCIRNRTACPVIVAPVAPVVAAPQYAPPVTDAPAAPAVVEPEYADPEYAEPEYAEPQYAPPVAATPGACGAGMHMVNGVCRTTVIRRQTRRCVLFGVGGVCRRWG